MFSHSSRWVVISLGSTFTGDFDSGPNFVRASGRAASGRTGYMYIWPGMSSWTALESIHSTKALPPSGLAAPLRTPAYSTWRKAVSSRAEVVLELLSLETVKEGEEA